MSLRFTWWGKEALLKALSEIDFEDPLNEALKTFTAKVAEDAKAIVPVRTGRLQKSIRSYNRGNVHSVGASAPYAVYVEYGTSKMSPRPYLVPAMQRNMKLLTGEIQKEVVKRNKKR